MREFVFRGKPKNKVEYESLRELCEDDCKNGFVYGSLVVSHGKYYICIMALQIRDGISNYITTMIEVFPETVGEYTGLNDKNGKKIYENDIVLLKGEEELYQVDFADGCFFFIRNGVRFTIDFFNEYYDHDIEAIGNIYDNPELLKEAK